MAICAEAPWCFEIDPESGEPQRNCVYSKLPILGYTSNSSASADGEDGGSTNYLNRSVYPDADAEVAVDKMLPERLKLVSIIQKCKLKQSVSTENKVVNKEENAYILSYALRKLANTNEKLSTNPTRGQTKWLDLETYRGPSGEIL